jgi:hypothetical protein
MAGVLTPVQEMELEVLAEENSGKQLRWLKLGAAKLES